MHSDTAIVVKNLTKHYRIFGHPGDRIKQALTLGKVSFHRKFEALKNVSFEIKRGETVGIVGRNGSGKSTLLQLVCGILKPTSGTVTTRGRVSALLELGAGFNPEFTGRENVYFQGAIMGVSKEEMERRFPDIEAFADIGEFIDQPVRVYSSGMYLRLAFSVAVNVDSEILVVDEALAVGDAGFRSRCFRRIGELRQKGCTILFVSHAMEQIVALCQRAILIDEGELLLIGQPESVVEKCQQLIGADPKSRLLLRNELQAILASSDGLSFAPPPPKTQPAKSNTFEYYSTDLISEGKISYEENGAQITSVAILTMSGERVNQLVSGRTYRCVFEVVFLNDARHVRYAILIKTSSGMDLGGAYSAPSPTDGVPSINSGARIEVEFEFNCGLNSGNYFINVAVFGSVANVEFALHGIIHAEAFHVLANPATPNIAIVDFCCRSKTKIIHSKNT